MSAKIEERNNALTYQNTDLTQEVIAFYSVGYDGKDSVFSATIVTHPLN